MRFARSKMIQITVPLLMLGAFYWGVFKFTPPKPKVKETVLPTLTVQQSRDLLEQSQALINRGNYEEALRPLLILHEAYPQNHIYIGRLADAYDHLGRYKEEANFWGKYLDQAPRPIEACPKIGQAYWKQGESKRPEAVTAFERCLAIDPTNTDSIFYLAHALEMSGQTDRAEELYERGLKISPRYTDLRLGLARIWLHQEKFAEAKKAVLDILAKSPKNVDALLVAGLVCLRQGNLREAKNYLRKGAQLSDEYTDFHVALGNIAERERDIPEAIRRYSRVLELRPENQDIRSRRDALMRARP